MDTLIAQLDQKYNQYLKNLHGDNHVDRDKYVFECAYEYFCITEPQTKIKELLEQDRLDLEKRKQDISTYNTSPKTQKEFAENAEFDSLYFCYTEVLKAVYIPMNKYKNASNPLSEKDIIGDISIFREKLLNIFYPAMTFVAKIFVYSFGWSIRTDFDMYMGLQKIMYNFKRKKYPLYMEQIHNLLIPRLLALHTQKQEPSLIKNTKIHIILDDKKGICLRDNPDLAYPLRKGKKRYKLIQHLVAKDNVPISELSDSINQTKKLTMKEIRNINKLFRENLDVVEDLIVHIDTGGYSLNKEIFSIDISQ